MIHNVLIDYSPFAKSVQPSYMTFLASLFPTSILLSDLMILPKLKLKLVILELYDHISCMHIGKLQMAMF